MATRAVALPAPRAGTSGRALVQGLATLYLSLIVLLPLAALLWRFGEPIRDFIERRLMLVTTMVAAALVGGFVVLRYL